MLLQCIGATTLDEYRKHIENWKDPALERRFQPVRVSEPTVDEAIEIIGLRERNEIHHKLCYTDEALAAAAQLSFQYMLPEEARELEKEMRQVVKEKNEAIRSQDFEKGPS